jgi:hypothetical protein
MKGPSKKNKEKFFANDKPVIFFHYSGYSLNYPDLISRHQDRFDMKANPALNDLFSICRETLLQTDMKTFRKYPVIIKNLP